MELLEDVAADFVLKPLDCITVVCVYQMTMRAVTRLDACVCSTANLS